MTETNESKTKVLELINRFEHQKHQLQSMPAEGKKGLLFASVKLLNKTEEGPADDSWTSYRVVRTDLPQVFEWLFKQFVPILSDLPNYGMHRDEIFGRLGNRLAAIESQEPATSSDDKVFVVFQELWAICQELEQGLVHSFSVALGTEIVDDFASIPVFTSVENKDSLEVRLFGVGV